MKYLKSPGKRDNRDTYATPVTLAHLTENVNEIYTKTHMYVLYAHLLNSIIDAWIPVVGFFYIIKMPLLTSF